MLKMLQRKYALSEKGAKDMLKSIVTITVSDMVLMLPAGLLYILIRDMLEQNLTTSRIPTYAIGSIIVLALIYITQHVMYNATFLVTYKESGVRRTTIAEKMRKLPLSYFGGKNLADLTNAIMTDCATMETACSHWIPELYGSIISTTIVGVILLFNFDIRMTLACLWVIPVAFAIVIITSGMQKKSVEKNYNVTLEFSDGVQECLECMKDLHAANAQDRYMEGLRVKIKNVEKQTNVAEFTMAVCVSLAQIILKLGIGTTALVGGILLTSGEINIITFFMFLMLVSRLYDPMQVSLQNLSAMLSTSVQSARLNEILSHEIQTGQEKLTNKGYDIEFKHVRFGYDNETRILNDVSFVAKQGEVTALIGSSGGGKTTVSRLAARFWDVTEGKITIGGMDISKIDPEKLMSLYSIVFQDVVLFNNTVKENIRIGKKDATDEEIIRAARLANCDEFIRKLPNGYDTVIGENGSNLSGGERQRISIARAFLKDAPIILLDEATASLDVENETQIQQALSNLIKNKTVLIIAHRMRTIANANKIVVLDEGVIKEQGSPKELLAKNNSMYRHMTNLQMQSANWKLC